jgi:L-threonylcarbamoyladenylate synthase
MIEDALVQHLKNSGVVAYPTSTLPGLGALPTKEGLDALFELKNRSADKPVSLGVLSLEQARDFVHVSAFVEKMEKHFPKGSITFVLKAHQEFDARLGGWWVAVRCFSNQIARQLVERVGPITATSANEAGEVPESTAEDAGRILRLPHFAILPGQCPGGIGSTFVKIDGDENTVTVLREGVLSKQDILDWIGEHQDL